MTGETIKNIASAIENKKKLLYVRIWHNKDIGEELEHLRDKILKEKLKLWRTISELDLT